MTNEHDWPAYHRLFQQAVNLETAGTKESALAIYRDIVDNLAHRCRVLPPPGHTP